jgi:hypothetical protein
MEETEEKRSRREKEEAVKKETVGAYHTASITLQTAVI